jgi:hypothetical protein
VSVVPFPGIPRKPPPWGDAYPYKGTTPRRRFELPSYGIDEFKQFHGSDPFGSDSWLGLRVPFQSTQSIAEENQSPQFSNRYLFMGARFDIAEGSKARIIGYRQLLIIGFLATGADESTDNGPVPITFEVVSPDFAFTDATVSWHFRLLGPPASRTIGNNTPANKTNLKNLIFRESDTPALLYEKVLVPPGEFYPDLLLYTPPNLGKPWGKPLTDDPRLSTIYGLQTKWRTPDAWGSLDVEVQGPDTVAAFISVAQTNPQTRPQLATTFSGQNFGLGFPPEEQFIMNNRVLFANTPNSGVIYWKVGVSLIVEVDSLVSEVRGLVGGEGYR